MDPTTVCQILKRKPLGQGDFARIYYAERELGQWVLRLAKGWLMDMFGWQKQQQQQMF